MNLTSVELLVSTAAGPPRLGKQLSFHSRHIPHLCYAGNFYISNRKTDVFQCGALFNRGSVTSLFFIYVHIYFS